MKLPSDDFWQRADASMKLFAASPELSARVQLDRMLLKVPVFGDLVYKTSVARWIEAKRAAGEEVPVRDVAASFQEAVVDVLEQKFLYDPLGGRSRLLPLSTERGSKVVDHDRCAFAGRRGCLIVRKTRLPPCSDDGSSRVMPS